MIKTTKTLIAVPCMDMMHTEFTKSLIYMHKGENVDVCFNQGSLIYDSRNLLSLTAIQNGFDYVLWLDSDMVVPKDALIKLRNVLKQCDYIDMVTGLYFKRKVPTVPVILRKLQTPEIGADGVPVKRMEEYTDYPAQQLFPVAGCGFGCVMTRVSLLKKVWDKYGPAFAPYPWAGEDYSFCYRVNQLSEHGSSIWCDSSVKCGHIGQMIYNEDMFVRR